MAATEALRLDRLTIGNEGRALHRGLTARVNGGELCCLLGLNGSGKSTLLRTVAGLQAPMDGQVLLDGSPLHHLAAQQRARSVAVVFSERHEPGHMRVDEYVALGRQPHTGWLGALGDADRKAIRRAVQQCDLLTLTARALGTLSDGERQRAAIARALAQETSLLVLDEPTAYLDLARRAEVMHLLKTLAHETGRVMLVSTHDLELALDSADRLWLLTESGLKEGMPESLALGGDLARAFASPALLFDTQAGAFRSRNTSSLRALLAGHGERATWTARALQRVGFAVVRIDTGDIESPGLLQSPVILVDELGWHIALPGKPVTHAETLDEALALVAHTGKPNATRRS